MKRYHLLLLTMLAAACADTPVLAPEHSVQVNVPDALYSAGPAAGFPVVNVRANAPTHGQGAVVSKLADALERVRPGGTVRVHPGEYVVQDVHLTRGVTIVGVGAQRPVINAAGADRIFRIIHAGAAEFTLRNLTFTNADWVAVEVHGTHGRILIEDSEFHETNGVEAWFTDGPTLEIRNNRFASASFGVNLHGVPDALVRGNSFADHSHAGVYVSLDGVVLIEDNEFRDATAAGHESQEVYFRRNRIQLTRPLAGNAVQFGGNGPAAGGTVTHVGNVIVGPAEVGRDSPPGDDRYYGINGGSWSTAIVRDNVIRNFEIGIGIADLGHKIGADNVIENVRVGFDIYDVQDFTFTRNDITHYLSAFDPLVDPADIRTLDLTCNWWGSSDGPEGADPGLDWAYTPWADGPIAGTTRNCP